jgi:HK97 family phage major capsid protein
MYAKKLREQMGRVGAQLQAIVDKAKNENARGLTSEERTQFHALETDYSTFEESIKAAEKASTITAQLAETEDAGKLLENNLEQVRDEFRTTPKNRAERMKDPHYRAFANMLRLAPHARVQDLSPEDRQILSKKFERFENTMSTTTGSQGGYVVPTGFSDMLEEAKNWFGGIEGIVDIFRTETGNPFPWPTLNDTANEGEIIGQNTQVNQADLAFGQQTFNAYIGSSKLVLIPLALIQDSYFDLDALVARLLGTRLGRLYNNKCTIGTGTNEPTGIVTAAVAAGNTVVFPNGQTASVTYNNLVDIEHAVDPDYRSNPSTRWMFSDAVLKILKKLVDGANRPLWQPGLSASFRDGAAVDLIAAKPMILDHPYVINSKMATPAADANSILFGDMSCFKVREVAGGTTLLRLTERYADYLQVGFLAFQRFDSQLIDAGTHPIAVGVQSHV